MSLNYKICGLRLMKDNTSCFDKLSDGHAELYSPPKHFSVVESHLCSSNPVYKLWYDQVHFCKARKNETNFEVVWVTSRSLIETDHFFFSAAPSSCQTMGWKQSKIVLWVVSVLTFLHRVPTQWKFCEHVQPQNNTCHSQLKSTLTCLI